MYTDFWSPLCVISITLNSTHKRCPSFKMVSQHFTMTKIFSSFVCELTFTVIDTMKCSDEDNDRVCLKTSFSHSNTRQNLFCIFWSCLKCMTYNRNDTISENDTIVLNCAIIHIHCWNYCQTDRKLGQDCSAWCKMRKSSARNATASMICLTISINNDCWSATTLSAVLFCGWLKNVFMFITYILNV